MSVGVPVLGLVVDVVGDVVADVVVEVADPVPWPPAPATTVVTGIDPPPTATEPELV